MTTDISSIQFKFSSEINMHHTQLQNDNRKPMVYVPRKSYSHPMGRVTEPHLTGGTLGLLPDTQNCGLRMRRECRERFPRHRLQRKPLVSDAGMHHGTCVTHVPWCMSGSLTRDGRENVPSIPSVCANRSFVYLVWGPWSVREGWVVETAAHIMRQEIHGMVYDCYTYPEPTSITFTAPEWLYIVV